jgi:hypothetical protein
MDRERRHREAVHRRFRGLADNDSLGNIEPEN